MYTEYTIPYPNAELHDVDVDKYGTVWWTDWRWPYLGRLNPETGEMKYWETPPVPDKEDFPGAHEIAFDKDENPWVSMVWSGGLLKFDRNTEKMSIYSPPVKATTQSLTIDQHTGRVWFGLNERGFRGDHAAFYDPATKEFRVFKDFPSYGQVTDSQGNTYGMLKGHMSHIGRIDAKTLNRIDYPTLTYNAFPRRGDYDSQDRIWFAEYSAAQLGMLDPKAGKITEWKIDLKPFGLDKEPDFVGSHPADGDHHQIGSPYGLGVDRNTDQVWLELFRLDRLVRFNPKTEVMTHYSLPERHLMSRSPRGDPKSREGHTIMWMGTLPKHGNGKILKIETW
jgi:virginiamycin B lyase